MPFEFVTYPSEGHFFTERKHIEDLIRRVLRFARAHLSYGFGEFVPATVFSTLSLAVGIYFY